MRFDDWKNPNFYLLDNFKKCLLDFFYGKTF